MYQFVTFDKFRNLNIFTIDADSFSLILITSLKISIPYVIIQPYVVFLDAIQLLEWLTFPYDQNRIRFFAYTVLCDIFCIIYTAWTQQKNKENVRVDYAHQVGIVYFAGQCRFDIESKINFQTIYPEFSSPRMQILAVATAPPVVRFRGPPTPSDVGCAEPIHQLALLGRTWNDVSLRTIIQALSIPHPSSHTA